MLKDYTKWHYGMIWENDKVAVPISKEEGIIAKYHDSPSPVIVEWRGRLLKRGYLFKGMTWKINQYVRTCDICQRCKADLHLPRGHTQLLEVPVQKWDSVSIDFVTMPKDLQVDPDDSFAMNEILTVTDQATKMVILLPCSNTMTAHDVAIMF